MQPLQGSNPFLASFAVGLLQGLTYCSLVCLPFLSSYVAGVEGGFRKGMAVSLVFGMGRVLAYGVLGGLAGIFKGLLTNTVYQNNISILFGIVIVLVGASLLLRKNASACTNVSEKSSCKPIQKKLMQKLDLRAFSMGFSRGLIPCAPLVVILLYSVALFSLPECILLAALFGLGTALSPLLLFMGAMRWLLSKAPSYRWWISKISGGILVLMGFTVLLESLNVNSS